jgi:hypothetical protein
MELTPPCHATLDTGGATVRGENRKQRFGATKLAPNDAQLRPAVAGRAARWSEDDKRPLATQRGRTAGWVSGWCFCSQARLAHRWKNLGERTGCHIQEECGRSDRLAEMPADRAVVFRVGVWLTGRRLMVEIGLLRAAVVVAATTGSVIVGSGAGGMSRSVEMGMAQRTDDCFDRQKGDRKQRDKTLTTCGHRFNPGIAWSVAAV